MSKMVKIAAIFGYAGLASLSSFLAILPLFPTAFVSNMDHGWSVPLAFFMAWGSALIAHPTIIFFMVAAIWPYTLIVKWMVKFSAARNNHS